MPFVTCAELSVTAPGATTVTFTAVEVAEIPAAVATAVNAYDPAGRLLAVTVNGEFVLEPRELVPTKNATLVTVPLLTVALAVTLKVAGAVNTELLVGVVMFTVGVGGAAGAVPRI